MCIMVCLLFTAETHNLCALLSLPSRDKRIRSDITLLSHCLGLNNLISTVELLPYNDPVRQERHCLFHK